MALFKIKKGKKANLPSTYTEGYCYLTTDDGKFYIDTSNAASGRIVLNAGKADQLSTSRTISLTGDVTGSATFDGSANASITATVANNSHNHNASNITAGTLAITRGGTGATTAAGILTNLGVTATATELNYVDGVTSNIQTQLDGKANKTQGVYYIEGTGSTAGTWLGSHTDITEYYPGLTVLYKIPIAGASTTTLNINSLGAITVVKNVTSAISTSYAVNSIVNLIYTLDGTTAYWKIADYDSNTKNSAGTSNKAATKLFLAGGTSQNSSGVTTYSNVNVYIGTDNCLYSNNKKVATTEDVNISRITFVAPASGWSQESTGRYTQTIAVANITSQTQCNLIDIDMTNVTESNIADIKQAWGFVDNAEYDDTGVKLTCFTDAPTTDIPLIIDIQGTI